MLSTGTKASNHLKPAGFISGKAPYNHERSHLIPRLLGGPGNVRGNLVTLASPANSPQMRDFEGAVARRVREGEVVEYYAKPLYDEGVLPPSAVLLTASGTRGQPIAKLVRNPMAPRR